jgi:chloramphenicol-sensitive protein RarD
VLIFNEPMPPARLAGFGLVWFALGVFTWDGIRHLHAAARTPTPTPTAVAAAQANS